LIAGKQVVQFLTKFYKKRTMNLGNADPDEKNLPQYRQAIEAWS